ncbi:MAG: NAD-dependent epimerase/dehydratase family protein [Acidobacteriota bacterium]|nr:NAD-dependent epimerase/dehydratase family protein [Acidobacteriota bacterium]
MRALLLGGTRFVGLRLLRALVSGGHQVTILNRGRREAPVPDGVERLFADRRNDEAVRAVLADHPDEYDVVFDVTGYQPQNLEPVVDTLGESIERYVFVSSFAVYTFPNSFPVRETSEMIEPGLETGGLAAYGADKVRCERYLLEAHASRGLPVAILRAGAMYGPENWMDDREGSYFARLLLGRKILVGGRGEALVHLGHVDDFAQACIRAAENPTAMGEVFNVTGPEAVSVNTLIHAFAAATGVEATKVYVPFGEGRESIDGIVPFQSERSVVCSTRKLEHTLDFQPRYDIRSGMAHTFDWWQRQRGIDGVRFEPGRLGHDVDLAAEDALIARWEKA